MIGFLFQIIKFLFRNLIVHKSWFEERITIKIFGSKISLFWNILKDYSFFARYLLFQVSPKTLGCINWNSTSLFNEFSIRTWNKILHSPFNSDLLLFIQFLNPQKCLLDLLHIFKHHSMNQIDRNFLFLLLKFFLEVV